MWMTTAEIKTYLGLTDTTYDTQIDLYNPVAQSRVESFIGYTFEDDEDGNDTFPLAYEPCYSRLVWNYIQESGIKTGSSQVKSQSFDGESVSYADRKTTDQANTVGESLECFKPLKKRFC